MRNVSFAVRVVIIVAVFSVSAVGQQPSPAVLLYPSISVDLPVEPVRIATPMTLADAARHNDFPLFDAMFNAAPRAEAAPYAELHSFWKWSMTDPIGGFYGDEMHARFAAAYPGYADYIADFGIIDSHGRAFYPSAETRAFLLKQANLGSQPSRLAEVSTPKRPTAARKTTKPAHVLPAAVKPAPVAAAVTAEAAPRPVATPVATKPAVAVATTQPQAVVRAARIVRPSPKTVTPASDARLGRGLLLIIAGLIGLGMLSVMLHAPGEEPAADATEMSDPLEPLHMIHLDEKPKKTA